MGISIPESRGRIKRALSGDLYTALIIVLVGLASFGLGRLSAIEEYREPVKIERASSAAAVSSVDGDAPATGGFVASEHGSRYHFPWCASASRIKEGNEVWFDSRAAAERAGYTPAANCKGL